MSDNATLVHLTTLGCARNDADSEQLAGRLIDAGFDLTPDPASADIVLVNTCGFIDAAKKDSIDALLAAADRSAHVVAVGCLAERYGRDLAAALPEVAVLGFADYEEIGARLRDMLVAPDEPVAPGKVAGGGHPDATPPSSGGGVSTATPWRRRRLETGPYAPLKIASGCDRRCAFCAIPGIRGKYRSRAIEEIVDEARWLVDQGVREVMLVSENSSSYGKDLGSYNALETLLGRLAAIEGLDWVRVSYLQPAEIRLSLLDAIASTPKVVPYFDLSFQHASGPVLKRMRRFGDAESFLTLLTQVRARSPQAGVRSSFIVGFPGETDRDVAVLHSFLESAGLDAIGVFAYSDEEGTSAHEMHGHLDDDIIAARYSATLDLATWLTESRAAERVGELVHVLVEDTTEGVIGRAAHQGPEVDGVTTLTCPNIPKPRVGDLIWAQVVDTDGVDLIAEPRVD